MQLVWNAQPKCKRNLSREDKDNDDNCSKVGRGSVELSFTGQQKTWLCHCSRKRSQQGTINLNFLKEWDGWTQWTSSLIRIGHSPAMCNIRALLKEQVRVIERGYLHKHRGQRKGGEGTFRGPSTLKEAMFLGLDQNNRLKVREASSGPLHHQFHVLGIPSQNVSTVELHSHSLTFHQLLQLIHPRHNAKDNNWQTNLGLKPLKVTPVIGCLVLTKKTRANPRQCTLWILPNKLKRTENHPGINPD